MVVFLASVAQFSSIKILKRNDSLSALVYGWPQDKRNSGNAIFMADDLEFLSNRIM